MFHGSTQQIPVTSVPDSAEVWIDGVRVGTTPMAVKLKRNSSYLLTVGKEDIGERTYLIERKLSAWFLGSFLLTGPIGCGIDLWTGGAYGLTPERFEVDLEKNASSEGKKADDRVSRGQELPQD